MSACYRKRIGLTLLLALAVGVTAGTAFADIKDQAPSAGLLSQVYLVPRIASASARRASSSFLRTA